MSSTLSTNEPNSIAENSSIPNNNTEDSEAWKEHLHLVDDLKEKQEIQAQAKKAAQEEKPKKKKKRKRFFVKLKNRIKKFGNGIVNTAEKIGGAAANIVGEVATTATRVVAGEEAARKVEKAFDERIEPVVKRSIKAVTQIALPITMLDEIIEHGLIDGVTQNVTEIGQDLAGSVARLVGGEEAEQEFDTFFDNKVQRWAEMATRIVGTAVLSFTPPVGTAILALDAASEVGSLAHRVSEGHKAGWGDAFEVEALLGGFRVQQVVHGQESKSLQQLVRLYQRLLL